MANAELKINLPQNPDSPEATVFGDKIVFVTIKYDHDPQSIFEDGAANGQIYSFNRRHVNYIGDNEENRIEELLKYEEAVPLSYFEHGLCLWSVAGDPTPPGTEYQWDGVRFAGLWVPDKDAIANIDFSGKVEGAERVKKLREYAAGVCELYTDWCNGSVYGFKAELYELQRDEDGDPITEEGDYDCRHVKVLEEDSCWGFYGWDTVVEAAQEAVQGMLK